MDKFQRYLLGTAAVAVVSLLTTILRGWVLCDLWRWFMEPMGLPGIGMAHAVGLSTLVGLLTHQPDPPGKDKDATFLLLYATFMSVGLSLMAWIMGALAHAYMG